jgi:hypothetical protein
MRRSVVWLLTLLAMIVIGGCATPRTVPLSQALGTVEHDLKDSGVLSVRELLSDDTVRSNRFIDNVRNAQCFTGQANPVVPITMSAFTLTLQGTFQDTTKVVGGAILTAPTLGLEFDVNNTVQQTLAIPLTFVSIEALPEVYLFQQLSYLAGVTDVQNKKDMTAPIIVNQNKMRQALAKLIKDYSDQAIKNTLADGICKDRKFDKGNPIKPITDDFM